MMKILLNSHEVASSESQQHFHRIIDFLIKELITDDFELESNIIDNGNFRLTISGSTGNKKKIYHIDYDVSFFRMIYDVLYVVLSNNAFFPEMGKSSKQFFIPTVEVPNWFLLNASMSTHDPVYFDKERKELHNFIYTLCLHFIARHEIRHIANGHVGFLLNRKKNEFVECFANGLTPIDSQTIEMDVDSNVTVGFLNGFINLPNHLSHTPIKLHGLENIFESLLFAQKILFYCLPSIKVSSLAEAEKLSHPNSSLRYFYSFTAGLSYLEELHPQLYELFGNTYQRTWSFFDILSKQGILNSEKVWTDYNWSISDEGQEHAKKVWNNWNNLIPKLQPYAILKLAPP